MAFVITSACIDVRDRACVGVCPVNCIYEGDRANYVQPDECIDCGACEPVCPVQAIFFADDLPDDLAVHAGDNAAFFATPLPGRSSPLGSPGGAKKIGRVGVDTPLVAARPGDAAP